MELTQEEKKLIIVACEMIQEQLKLTWMDYFLKYIRLTKRGRELYELSNSNYLNLINKLRTEWDINEKIFLDKL